MAGQYDRARLVSILDNSKEVAALLCIEGLGSSRRAETNARIRQIIAAATPATTTADREAEISAEQSDPLDERRPPCPCCGGRMILVERFAPGMAPRTIVAVRIDTS